MKLDKVAVSDDRGAEDRLGFIQIGRLICALCANVIKGTDEHAPDGCKR